MPKVDRATWCTQCKAQRPAELFLKLGRGWRVTICTPCARGNMASYHKYVEMDAVKVAKRGVDA